MTGTYVIEIDWNNDGDYGDSGENVTADTRSVRIDRGRDEELGRVQAGVCDIELDNSDNTYSPEYSSSPLYGNLLPGRTLRVRSTAPETEELFTGTIEGIIPHPHRSEQRCHIKATDGFERLATKESKLELYTSVATGTAIGHLLDEAGWSATDRALDAGQATLNYLICMDETVLDVLYKIQDTELGLIYIRGDGYFVFEDRHHRLKAPHTTSQYTFNATMKDIDYEYSRANIRNEIKITITPWTAGDLTDLWGLNITPSIPSGESITFYPEYGAPATSVVTPAANTDYTANSAAGGGGVDMTSDIGVSFTTKATTAELQLTNNGIQPAFITSLRIRGEVLSSEDLNIIKSDATSQTAYGKMTKEHSAAYLDNFNVAEDYANYLLSFLKDPRASVTMRLNGYSDAILGQMLLREISDRITVVQADLGLNTDFYINRISHYISGKNHECEWRLSKATDETYWILGTSQLNTDTRLAF